MSASSPSYRIEPYRDAFHDQLVSVWEKSVRATHLFLAPEDIDYFKGIVAGIDFNALPVFCLTAGDTVLGFMGVVEQKIEMLFLSPEYIGRGYGKVLMNFALENLKADQVDVNEQNQQAVQFYSRFGFATYDRTEKDSEGKDYPILKMKLKNTFG